jgi:hypothetical protein
MKLTRRIDGSYHSEDLRFQIQRGGFRTNRRWTVWDDERGDHTEESDPEEFDRFREAVDWIASLVGPVEVKRPRYSPEQRQSWPRVIDRGHREAPEEAQAWEIHLRPKPTSEENPYEADNQALLRAHGAETLIAVRDETGKVIHATATFADGRTETLRHISADGPLPERLHFSTSRLPSS